MAKSHLLAEGMEEERQIPKLQLHVVSLTKLSVVTHSWWIRYHSLLFTSYHQFYLSTCICNIDEKVATKFLKKHKQFCCRYWSTFLDFDFFIFLFTYCFLNKFEFTNLRIFFEGTTWMMNLFHSILSFILTNTKKSSSKLIWIADQVKPI